MNTTVNPAGFARPDTLESEMVARQWQLEEDMSQRGAEAFLRNTNNARIAGREDQTSYGATLMAHRVDAVAAGVKAFMDEAASGKAGRRHLAVRMLAGMDPATVAFLTLRGVVSNLTAPRTYQYMTTVIGGLIEDEIRLSAVRAAESKKFRQIMEGVKKRVGYDYKRIYALRATKELSEHTPWTRIERLQVGAKLLDILIATTGIVEAQHQKEGKNKPVIYVVPTEDTLAWIDRRNAATSLLRPHFEPMVVPPKEWTGAYGGGYLSSHIPPLPMVKVRNKTYLAELESADLTVPLAAINAIQNTAWQINPEVLAVMNKLWDESSTLANLPPRDGIEMPAKPGDIETNEAARREWRIKATKVRQRNMSSKGSRIAINMTLGCANRYKEFERIYFPCQFDFRGRVYSVTTLSPQGSDTTKALLRFADGKPLGEHGATWLAYQGANLAGNDKVSLEERVQWVLDNEDEIIASATDPHAHLGWCTEIGGVEIDSPWQFLAFCYEWKGYREQGEAFVSRIPVAMDGSCSGIQHFSAMLRDPKGGAAVNLVPADKPQDVYAIVAEIVKKYLADAAANGTEDALAHTDEGRAYVREGTKTFAKQWMEFGVTRKVTKRSVMTLAYGSKEYGFRQQLMEDIVKPAMDDATSHDGTVDRHAFPFSDDGYNAAGFMAKAIWNAVSVTLVAAVGAMKWLQEAASLAASENLPVRWTTPVGFPVMQEYKDTKANRVDTILAGKLVRATMYTEKPELSTTKMASAISPNFVHSCDAAHLMLTVARGTQAGIHSYAMVHDSFGTLAADMEVFFPVVREAFVEIYTEVNVLEAFRDEINLILSPAARDKLKPLPATGTLDVALVKESRYCFA
ncbi:DNA-directed RNA polymerase [Variovorax sp. PMC12]|uniref:DNA-directed RNA polymerase n=1 Tax=Variovorax sp. PMC12 TaxID=2126319 RepID=UPI000D133B32|nr:DNA-directed RNA polymerase [Variovorax sp. PMC12]AVQ80729.1 DNA-dependent RNA polymerase [Variovorax sp. PMC12]